MHKWQEQNVIVMHFRFIIALFQLRERISDAARWQKTPCLSPPMTPQLIKDLQCKLASPVSSPVWDVQTSAGFVGACPLLKITITLQLQHDSLCTLLTETKDRQRNTPSMNLVKHKLTLLHPSYIDQRLQPRGCCKPPGFVTSRPIIVWFWNCSWVCFRGQGIQ